MPRTKTPVPVPLDESFIDNDRLAQDVTAVDQLAARLHEVDAAFGDGLPYDRERVVNETRFYMAQSAEAMLEAGKRLILIKENEPHGEFTRIIEERLGLAPQVARRMMQASIKFLGADLGGAKRSALSVLGKTKLYELMVLDDEELDELAEGGTVAGLVKDDVDRMTSRELRIALRQARADAEAKARVLADKNAKIDELATRLERRRQPTPDEQTAQRLAAERMLIDRLFVASQRLLDDIHGVAQAVADVLAEPTESRMTAAETTVQWLFQRVNEIAIAHQIPVDFTEIVTPSWARDVLGQRQPATQEG